MDLHLPARRTVGRSDLESLGSRCVHSSPNGFEWPLPPHFWQYRLCLRQERELVLCIDALDGHWWRYLLRYGYRCTLRFDIRCKRYWLSYRSHCVVTSNRDSDDSGFRGTG